MSKPTQYGRIHSTARCTKARRVRVRLHPRLSDDPVFFVFDDSAVHRSMHQGDILRWNADRVWWDPVTHEGKTYVDPILVKSLPLTYDDKLALRALVK